MKKRGFARFRSYQTLRTFICVYLLQRLIRYFFERALPIEWIISLSPHPAIPHKSSDGNGSVRNARDPSRRSKSKFRSMSFGMHFYPVGTIWKCFKKESMTIATQPCEHWQCFSGKPHFILPENGLTQIVVVIWFSSRRIIE